MFQNTKLLIKNKYCLYISIRHIVVQNIILYNIKKNDVLYIAVVLILTYEDGANDKKYQLTWKLGKKSCSWDRMMSELQEDTQCHSDQSIGPALRQIQYLKQNFDITLSFMAYKVLITYTYFTRVQELQNHDYECDELVKFYII